MNEKERYGFLNILGRYFYKKKLTHQIFTFFNSIRFCRTSYFPQINIFHLKKTVEILLLHSDTTENFHRKKHTLFHISPFGACMVTENKIIQLCRFETGKPKRAAQIFKTTSQRMKNFKIITHFI